MPTTTVQATAFSSPNPDTGGSAVTSPSTTGHAATLATVTGIGIDNHSCKWTPFIGNVQGPPSAVRVKFDWSRTGALGAGTSNGWNVNCGFGPGVGENEVVFSEANVTGSSSGSVNYSLTAARIRVPEQLFVADFISATGAIGQTASLTITISNVQLEVDWQQPGMIVMM